MNKQIRSLLFAALAAVTLCGCGEIMDEVIDAAVDEALGELFSTEAQEAAATEAAAKEKDETQAESETDYNYEATGTAADTSLDELSSTEEQEAAATEAAPKEKDETPAEPQAESETDYNYEITYTFRNDNTLRQHFEKHGGEFGYASEQEYVEGANSVIISADALHKTEAEDGDDVYYLEESNEFVVVSTDGYIRTYFKPTRGIDYFYAQ